MPGSFQLITIGTFISVTGFLFMGKILTGTATVAELLLITGGTDTFPTVAAVIGTEYRCREDCLLILLP